MAEFPKYEVDLKEIWDGGWLELPGAAVVVDVHCWRRVMTSHCDCCWIEMG